MSKTHLHGPGLVDKTLNQPPPVHCTRWELQPKARTKPVTRTRRGKVTKGYQLTPYGRRFLNRLGARGSKPSFLILSKQPFHGKYSTSKPNQAHARCRRHCMEEPKIENYNDERENFHTTGAERAASSTSAALAGVISKSDSSLFGDFVGRQRTSRNSQRGSNPPLKTAPRNARRKNTYLERESSPGCRDLFVEQDSGNRETREDDKSPHATTWATTHHSSGLGIGIFCPYFMPSDNGSVPRHRKLLAELDQAAKAFHLESSTVQKIVSEILPPASGIAFGKDARDLLIECCVEFITLISSEANEISEKEAKKTIACEHITKALEHLGFGEYVADILTVASEHKEQLKGREKRTNKLESSKLTTEEMLALQEAEFREAAARHK